MALGVCYDNMAYKVSSLHGFSEEDKFPSDNKTMIQIEISQAPYIIHSLFDIIHSLQSIKIT